MAIQKAKAEQAEAQKRAKNCKEARRNRWFRLVLFTAGLVFLCHALVEWLTAPRLPVFFDLSFACGYLLAGAFLRADSQKTLRGIMPSSVGAQLSLMLAHLSFAGKLLADGHGPFATYPVLFLFPALALFIVAIMGLGGWMTHLWNTRNKGTL